MKRIKHYAFLDVVLDVFYSIILYNAFISFPGLKLESWLMVFALFVMLNYWWIERSFDEPKYYLLDFYCVSIIMFLFAIWPSHFGNITDFLIITVLVFLMDAVFCLVDLYIHKEQKGRNAEKFYIWTDLVLAAIYGIFIHYLTVIDTLSVILLFAPYMIWFIANVNKHLLNQEFVDNGNQPY